MARTVDEAAHGQRRDNFIDAMERLLVTKGFQVATIADVLRETGASKGAFYHYFDSKTALLQALLERLLERMVAAVEPVLESDASALRKFDDFATVLARWKTDRREMMLAAARAWYSEDNALPRENLRRLGRERMARPLAAILRQGNADGDFDTPEPEAEARLVVAVLQDLQEFLADWIIGRRPARAELAFIHGRVAAYNRALDRLLGAAPGTIRIVSESVLDQWLED